MGIHEIVGLKKVIMTLLDPTSSPAKAGWGRSEWIAWRRLVHGKRHIGLELEYKSSKKYGFGENPMAITGLFHTRINDTDMDNNIEHECVQLFPLSSPSDFTSSVTKFIAKCKKSNIPTLGSIHLNILRSDENSYGANRESGRHSDFVNGIKYIPNIYRSENKRFSGFILESDLRAQMVLFLGAYTLCTYGREYDILFNHILAYYPDSFKEHWARIDLSKVLG